MPSDNLILFLQQVEDFARKAHKGQFRKSKPINFEHTKLNIKYKQQFIDSYKEGIINIDGNLITYENDTIKIAEPYIVHPIAVAGFLTTIEEKVGALLHDVAEDTKITIKEIHDFLVDLSYELKVPINISNVICALNLLNHDKTIPYNEYIAALCQCILAVRIKIADICHNLSCNPSSKAIKKYTAALPRLLASL